MKKVYFVNKNKSRGDFRAAIAGLLFAMTLIVIAFMLKNSSIVSFCIFVLLGILMLSLLAQMIIRGDLKYIVINDDGISIRKFLKPNILIKWENVKRAETTRMNMNTVTMVVVEGYDEISGEPKAIYTEDRYMTKWYIKDNLKKVKKQLNHRGVYGIQSNKI